MGKLRDEMKMEMELRNYSPKTIQAYIGHMTAFTRMFHKSPAEMGQAEIRQYLHHLKTVKKVSYSNINIAYSALKFFYTQVLRRQWQVMKLPRPRMEKRIPLVLAPAEIEAMLEATENLKQRVILMTAYSAGLRVLETAQLKVTDIDSQRMTIRVEQGKGKKDRYTLLSKSLLLALREYYKQYRPKLWLFPGKHADKPLATETLQELFQRAKKKPASASALRFIPCATVLPRIS